MLVIESIAPLQNMISSIRQKITYFFDHYVFIINAQFENEQLRERVATLEATIFQLEELRRENKRLKQLLQFGEEIPYEKVLAQVIGVDSSSEFKVLRINKGLKDGIKLRAPVVTSSGLVGHIYRITNHFADILTILDQNGRIDAIVDRTRSHGIVQGYSENKCIMKYVTRTEPVNIGDQVITAGLGNIYPKGLPVGIISNIERESYGITQLIEIAPNVDFGRLEEVIILISRNPEYEAVEWNELEKNENDEER